MSNPVTNNPLFLASAALNIFLVAFIFGRLSGQPEFPPPPFMSNMSASADRGPPPPFMGPDDLFTQKERDENFAALKTEFDKARTMREEFAAKLKKGPVARKDIIAHFTQMDDLMDHVKSIMMEKIADKITKLDQKGRTDFADHLLKRHEGEGGPNGGPGCPPGGPNGHGPDDHGPGEPGDHGPNDHGPDGDMHGPDHAAPTDTKSDSSKTDDAKPDDAMSDQPESDDKK